MANIIFSGEIFQLNLTQLSFIGSDARKFLHQLVTSDLVNLPESRAQYSAWCTAKGRVISTFLLYQSAIDTVSMILPADQQQYVATNLAKYIMRSKVCIVDQAANYQIFALITEANEQQNVIKQLILHFAEAQNLVNDIEFTTLQARQLGKLQIITIDRQRLLIVVASEHSAEVLNILQSNSETNTERYKLLWQLGDINNKIAWISAKNREDFVPQMIELEEIGALSFTKGCYPGQEIVARSQYIGRVKRHLLHYTCSEILSPASELFNQDNLESAVGKIMSQVDCRAYPDLQQIYGDTCGLAVVSESANTPLATSTGALVELT